MTLSAQMFALIAGGMGVVALIVFQILTGYRKIKFKGRTHWKVHKVMAWVILGTGLVHGAFALAYFGAIPGIR